MADFGADQWTNVNGSDWVYTSDNSSNNDITTGTIDGGGNVLATTTIYYNGGIINRATIIFDSAENWYLGTGVPGGSLTWRPVTQYLEAHPGARHVVFDPLEMCIRDRAWALSWPPWARRPSSGCWP